MFAEGEEMYLQGKSNKQKITVILGSLAHTKEKFSVAEGLVQ